MRISRMVFLSGLVLWAAVLSAEEPQHKFMTTSDGVKIHVYSQTLVQFIEANSPK